MANWHRPLLPTRKTTKRPKKKHHLKRNWSFEKLSVYIDRRTLFSGELFYVFSAFFFFLLGYPFTFPFFLNPEIMAPLGTLCWVVPPLYSETIFTIYSFGFKSHEIIRIVFQLKNFNRKSLPSNLFGFKKTEQKIK